MPAAQMIPEAHPAGSVEIAARLRRALLEGDAGALAGSYAPGARLDAGLPGERVRLAGAEEILARLSSWWAGPGRLVEWEPRAHPEGLALWFERVGADGSAIRQRHYLHVRGGRVARHWIYAAPPRTGPAPAPEASDAGAAALARLGRVVERVPLRSTGWSGNSLERVVLADGRRLVVKRVVPAADWLGRATGDAGREGLLFSTGVLDRVPRALDHTVLAAERDGDAWWVIQRDASADLLDADSLIPRAGSRQVLRAANAMWEEFWDERIPCLTTLSDRLGALAPRIAERERAGLDLLPNQVEAAWEAFVEAVDADVADAVLAILEDPAALAAELERGGTTLIHGDLRDEHLGFAGDRVVLLDWGNATQGHPAVELAWYLVHGAWRTDATHDQIVDDFRAVRGERDDPRALDLGMISGLVMYGWIFGHSALVHPDPAERAWAREELGWWVPRVRCALETWSPR